MDIWDIMNLKSSASHELRSNAPRGTGIYIIRIDRWLAARITCRVTIGLGAFKDMQQVDTDQLSKQFAYFQATGMIIYCSKRKKIINDKLYRQLLVFVDWMQKFFHLWYNW